MKSILLSIFSICLACLTTFAQSVNVDFKEETGPIKILNAVNGFPTDLNDKYYRNAEFPYGRSHDANLISRYGAPHVVDITALFPNWDADENQASSYNFVETDKLYESTMKTGTQVFFRLGESIEHTVKRYDVIPPKDFHKWARICEHVIRHYNEGWADGFHWNIQYWEIWNEFELDKCWTGTFEQFFDFYAVTAKYLKKKFPDLKIGGPASCGSKATLFIEETAKRNAPMDFFSWHVYSFSPDQIGELAQMRRDVLDRNGNEKTENILNEWNIYPYAVSLTMTGAAFTAATMANLQSKPIDMMMYYDVRPGGIFNGVFGVDGKPLKSYWAFIAWKELRKLGTCVKTTSDSTSVYAVAAKDSKGNAGILLALFEKDVPAPRGKNTINRIPVTINVPGVKLEDVRAQLVDSYFDFGSFPVDIKYENEKTSIQIEMEAQSFAWISCRIGN